MSADGEYKASKGGDRKRRQRADKSGADANESDAPVGEGDQKKMEAQASMFLAIMNERLSDTLKLLDYDSQFCSKHNLPPISQHYFAFSTSASEQLHYFAHLFSWLISFQRVELKAPDEYADPNLTCQAMLSKLKEVKIFPETTMSQILKGSGKEVCQILDALAQRALEANSWEWGKPIIPREDFQEEQNDEGAFEVTAENAGAGEADEIDDNVDDDEDEYTDVAMMHRADAAPQDTFGTELLLADIDAREWRNEVERVLPRLKVMIRNTDKDWRTRVDQMVEKAKDIDTIKPQTLLSLGKLHTEITRTLEKIDSREKYVNKQLDLKIREFREHHDKLASTQEKYKQAGGTVTELTRELTSLGNELDAVKTEMDKRGNSIVDGSPLVELKQALTRLKSDIQDMDLRIGVVQHTLLHAKLNERKHMTNDMNRAPIPDYADTGAFF